MSLFIQTNVSSMVAQNNFASTELKLNKTMSELSSGYKINSAADDAAGLGIAKRLDAQVQSYSAAQSNATQGISMAQTADGGAEQISNVLTRMRELAVEGANGTLSTSDSANLDQEFQAAMSDIDNISKVTTYNGQNLLNGTATSVAFQTGINEATTTATENKTTISFGGADSASLGLSGVSVSDASNAGSAITAIDAAIQKLSTVRAGFGAAMNSMQTAVSNLQTQQTNTAASLSSVQDVDVAQATADLARQQVLAQAGESVLAQANQTTQLATNLIHGQ
jgi:flagellin